MESVNYTSKRYALLLGFSAWFILFSFLLRIVFLFWQLDEIDLSIINLLKILFTGFTLGAGFKGGEVTPLFFVGAALGSALSTVIPMPIALLAGIGFVAVFSGATHTPIACTIMGMELFGIESGIFIAIGCTIAYFSSGSIGIYKSQIVKGAKYKLYQRFKGKELEHL